MVLNLQKNELINGCKYNENHNPKLCVPSNKSVDPRGLGTVLLENMRKYGDRIAQIYDRTDTKETYAEFTSKCIRAAQAMVAKGIHSGDIISFCTMNNKDMYIPVLAALFLGIKIAPLDPALDLRDVIHLSKLVKPRLIFCDAEGEHLMEKILEQLDWKVELVVFGNTIKHTPFSEFQIIRDAEDTFQARNVDDIKETAVIHFTSGTTGLPKGVCLSHFSLLCQCSVIQYPFVNLSISRLFWISSTTSVFFTVLGGGSWVLSSDFEIDNIREIIEKYKVNFIMSGAYYAYQFLDNEKQDKYDFSSLMAYMVGGSALGSQKQMELRKVFPNATILCAYGQTEMTGGVIFFNFVESMNIILEKNGSCGQAQQGICVKVIDPETGKVLGPNQPGELLVKSHYVMNGYFNDPTATANVFDQDGYFHTGDILYYDEDYCFFYVDRIKSMIRYRGWTISPVALEEELLSHPDVKEASVVGIPVEADGDHPTAIVVLKDGSNTTPEELVAFVDARVADLQRLRGGVKIVDSIPKTVSSKMEKHRLRSLIMNGKL